MYDALKYWNLSRSFGDRFSFFKFNDDLRGYGWPLVLRGASALLGVFTSSPAPVTRFLSVLVFPVLLCVVVPSIVRAVSPGTEVKVSRLVLLAGFFFVFWGRDLLYPLTDIPALALMGASLAVLLRWRHPATALAAGVAAGLAFNFRPAYLLALLCLPLLIVLLDRQFVSVAARVGALVVGVALALAPQVALNHRHHGSFAVSPIRSNDLSRQQLLNGLQDERYDTFIGPESEYPRAEMVFENSSLTPLLRNEGVQFRSLSRYARFVAHHPVDVAAAYARHVVTGLDPRFQGTYVEHLDRSTSVTSLANQTVMAAGVVLLVSRLWRARRRLRTKLRTPVVACAVVVAAACVSGVTGATEVRYLMPLHLSLAAVVFLGARRDDLPGSSRGRVIAIGSVGVLVLALAVVSAQTMNHLVMPS